MASSQGSLPWFRAACASGLVAWYAIGTCYAAPTTLEIPIPFDADSRVHVLTPQIAARLSLAPPEWPVAGLWIEARLYRSDGASVLVVEREGGALERFPMADGEIAALQSAVDLGLEASGSLNTLERLDVTAEPAGGRFVRNQVFLGALVYGPSATLLAGDSNEEAAAALYLATTGATILVATKISKSQTISRPQAHLSTDGGWKGAAAGAGLAYALGANSDDDVAYGAALLAGGVAGSAAGFVAGRSLTDAEAHAASFGSTFSAALTIGLLGITGGFGGETGRFEAATIVAGGLAGYPLGMQYARRASYAITAGDVGALTAATGIGILGAAAFVVDQDDSPDERAVAAVLTAGLLAGTFAGDRLLVRPFDHTETEGWLAGIGAVAGGLIGAAVVTLSDSENGAAVTGASAAGAALGMLITERMLAPSTGSRRTKP